MSLLWMEYETEFEHLVENGDHAQYHPDDERNRMEVIDTVSMIGPYMNEVLPPTPPKRKQQPIDIPDLYTFFFTQ